MKKIVEGIEEFISISELSFFDERELEFVISGISEIDVEDWKAHTDYNGWDANSKHIKWFWEVVASFDNESKARLLQFVTGTSRVPPDGFKALYGSSGPQKFTITKTSHAGLPIAHTCFNRIDLPKYHSVEETRQKIQLAFNSVEGFDIQ
eukprot:TRINITY_DN12033_c0_g1_i1.p1 TRINITY_DN12033_c0_g1~~TRINITY_DN12033_c0_g1_i1.p1  ORF type:complete len:168 (-),score=60.58 TRINITY_DN12033_c0_g1_i1:64-513(-)